MFGILLTAKQRIKVKHSDLPQYLERAERARTKLTKVSENSGLMLVGVQKLQIEFPRSPIGAK